MTLVYPHLTVPGRMLDRTKLSRFEYGSYTIVLYNSEIDSILAAAYGRRGLCVKVLKGKVPQRIVRVDQEEPYRYGKTELFEATVIQNLAARRGMAPRVYGWASVNNLIAQVIEYIPNVKDPPAAEREARCVKLQSLLDELGLISVAKTEDIGVLNWRDGKYVDFSHLNFKDYPGYIASLDIRARTRRGEVLPKAYQGVPLLGIVGTRDIPARIENLRLHDIDWKGKNVIDIGCNFGAFCRYATDAGAKRVVGIDKAGELAFEINNALGYWNMDIVTRTFPHQKRLPKVDIVFMMAFHNYVGGLEAALSWSAPVANNLMIVESHGGEDQAYCEAILRKYFKRIDYLGYVQDPQVRHQWHCWK